MRGEGEGCTYLEGLILVLLQYIEAFSLLHQVSKQQKSPSLYTTRHSLVEGLLLVLSRLRL